VLYILRCAGFPRHARKTRTQTIDKYHAAAGKKTQL
jgi:hypothetical protein